MTVLIETYKDDETTTAYYGYILDDITDIALSRERNYLAFYQGINKVVATVGIKRLKRLEICEDGE